MSDDTDWNGSQSTTIIHEMCLQNPPDNDIVALYHNVFTEPRHMEEICRTPANESTNVRAKDRMKTMSVAVVMCLNVGCDPPDVNKPQPCAILECWIDPFSIQQSKASETIAKELVKQYERWQPRARCKFLSDPTLEDVKKLTISLRRSSKEERVLFHYNGHGVPQPTDNGEIWVFNKNFTQYIPLSLYDLQGWMGLPSIYVFDCSNGGVIHSHFLDIAKQHLEDFELNKKLAAQSEEYPGEFISEAPNFRNFILLIASEKDEQLPLNEGMPADLFTACLTTPIKTFIIWFLKNRKDHVEISPDIADKIPGSLTDRKTMLGELNWIFTAITDTIAWNTLSKELFQRLFRQDLLVASLFRNYLLAQRIMRSYDCTPMSFPEIKACYHHPLWASWDLAVDKCLSLLAEKDFDSNNCAFEKMPQNQFFTEQLTAFQVWLKLESLISPSVPEQLPIILQVLLSQAHRSRALELLGTFLNLGPSAVDHALSVGIFPYVLKLLQTNAKEVKPLLVYIWAKILAIAEPYQTELVREGAHLYFLNVLADGKMSINHQVMSAFILSVMVRRYPIGQNLAVKSGSSNPSGSLIDICLLLLLEHQHNHSNLRKWLLICLGNVWENNEDVRWLATRNSIYEKLYPYLEDPVAEVRTAAVFALGTFINSVTNRNDHANDIDYQIVLTMVQKVSNDSSSLVRREFLVTIQWFVLIFEKMFHSILRKNEELEQSTPRCSSAGHSPRGSVANFSSQNGYTGSIDSNGSSPNYLMTPIRKLSIREVRISTGITSNLNKLLPLPVSITVPTNLSSVGNISPSQFTPPNSSIRSTSSLRSCTDHKFVSGITNIYNRVWHVLETLCCDPDPSVSKMALTLFKNVQDKYNNTKDNASIYSQSNSPTNRHEFIDSQDSVRSSSRNSSMTDSQIRQRRSISINYSSTTHGSRSFVHPAPRRSIFGREPFEEAAADSSGYQRNGRSSHSFSEPGSCRRPLIKTSFVDWCTSHFSRPCNHYGGCDCTNFDNLKINLDKEWRRKTLTEYYRKARNKLENIPVVQNKLLVHTKCLGSSISTFHPFEKNLMFSTSNEIFSWDISVDGNEPKGFSNEHRDRITDLKLINTHGNPLTMVAMEGGAIKIWRNLAPVSFSSICPEECPPPAEPSLAVAFYMFDDVDPFRGDMTTKLHWQQANNRLIAGGGHRVVRLWDAESERKIRDIVTDVDMVTSISTDELNLICLSSDDGYVKIFDERTQLNRPVFSIRQHNSSVIGAKVWPHDLSIGGSSINIVTGSREGQISWYDQRLTSKPVRAESDFGSPLTAMTFHENLDVFACSFGSSGDMRIFTLDTLKSPAIKINNEIKHLSFHPLKSKLSFISTDGMLRVMKVNLLSFSAQ